MCVQEGREWIFWLRVLVFRVFSKFCNYSFLFSPIIGYCFLYVHYSFSLVSPIIEYCFLFPTLAQRKNIYSRALASKGKKRKMGKKYTIGGPLLQRGKNGKWEKNSYSRPLASKGKKRKMGKLDFEGRTRKQVRTKNSAITHTLHLD